MACQVPEMRERLLARSDWAELAARQAAGPLGPGLAELSQARAASLLRGFRFMCELEPDVALPGPQACASCSLFLGSTTLSCYNGKSMFIGAICWKPKSMHSLLSWESSPLFWLQNYYAMEQCGMHNKFIAVWVAA